MKYRVSLSSAATQYLRRADRPTQERITRKIELIRGDPLDSRYSKPLAGLGEFRSARVGGLRLIFVVLVEESHISIERIAPRGQVYRDL